MIRTWVVLVLGAVLLAACGGDSSEQASVSETPAASPRKITFSGNVDSDLQTIDSLVAAGPFSADWASLETIGIPDWYQDAKFGIFIHWGVYSVPAYGNEWYPRRMYQDRTDERRKINIFRHHLKTWGPQKEFGYKDFIPKFTAESFNAAEWAAVFKQAGAKYVVPVAEHHDGFPMYASSYTKWDASEMGPKRDVIAELEGAVRTEGMYFGVSSHRAFNWAYYPRRDDFDTVDPANFGLYGKPREFQREMPDNRFPPQDEEFKREWLGRTAELAYKYTPDLFWFDFGIAPEWMEETTEQNHYAPYLQKFAAFYYDVAASQGKTGVINYKHRAFPEKAAVLDVERGKLAGIRERYWQTDTSVSLSSWGYVENHEYKDVNRIVDDLIDIVSKNGGLLLNIGPKADGTIPEREVEMLREIGAWLRVNGEAIYGTRPWKIYGEGPTLTEEGPMREREDKPMTAADIRYTAKGSTLYAIALDWPKGDWRMPALGSDSPHLAGKKIAKVGMVGISDPVEWYFEPEALVILPPEVRASDHAYVFRIEVK